MQTVFKLCKINRFISFAKVFIYSFFWPVLYYPLLGGSKLKVHLASPPDRPTVSARHGFRLGTSDRPTRRAQRGGANFELFWVGRPDRPTLFHRQRWVGSRFSGVSANFTRPTDPPAPDSPLSGWVGPPARPTLSAAAPGRKVYFQLRTALTTGVPSWFSRVVSAPPGFLTRVLCGGP